MHSIFKNAEHQEFINTNGYLKLSFLNDKEINQLINIHNSIDIINNTACFASNTVLDSDRNKEISERILSTVQEKLNQLFTGFECHGGTFLIKRKQNGELALHQDNTIVDDAIDTAYYLWIPLEDVHRKNGCMFVLPGSHLYFDNYVSYTLKNQDIDRRLLPLEFIQDIEMKKGEILIFSSKLFHGSYTNNEKSERVAVNILITNKDAKLVYYNKKNDAEISKYIIEPHNYLNSYSVYSKGGIPHNAEFEKDINYSHIYINHKILFQKISPYKYPHRIEIGYKISNLFYNLLK